MALSARWLRRAANRANYLRPGAHCGDMSRALAEPSRRRNKMTSESIFAGAPSANLQAPKASPQLNCCVAPFIAVAPTRGVTIVCRFCYLARRAGARIPRSLLLKELGGDIGRRAQADVIKMDCDEVVRLAAPERKQVQQESEV